MKVLDSPIKVQIPSRDNIRYLHIKNFENHDLSHNLVLDMIIRNEEFKTYMYEVAIIDFKFENMPKESKEKHYKKLHSEIIKKFGFDIKDEISLISHHPYINEQIINHVENVANENLILNPPFIRDIKNGIKRVIDFYFNKKQLYILIPSNYEKIDDKDFNNMDDKSRLYVKIVNPTNSRDNYILLSVYEDNPTIFSRLNNYIYKLPPAKLDKVKEIDDDFILKNFPLLGIPITTFGKEKIVSLTEDHFPIEYLDNEFKASLKENDIIDPSIKDTIYKTILPDIKLSNSKSVNININPDLSPEELMEKITNLQLNTKNIKSFVDIFNQEIDAIEKINNLKHISKSKEKRNRDYSNAFFIYDLYKIIGSEFAKKINELDEEAQAAIDKIKDNPQYDSKEIKQHEYDKIDTKLKNNLTLFNKTSLDKEIQKITNIEISKLRGLHSLMKEYIDDSRFRNVILTQHTSSFL
ncbi:hypothetical protein CPG38_13475 [Malaciobacter marinus]|uniref:hypothetical protein n=1 Tax=Malaciobacter marinus TaxID=505249 RepID=UPI000C0747EA|nr:hypothetical protein [Malaciobacter marinus]PHO11345.1 hypothetical protein CPG38_13475 [Malaciobacter marinus]